MWDLTSQRLHFKNSDLYGDSEGNIVLINNDTGAVDITGIGYAIGHYARWVKPGAVLIDATSSDPLVQVSAFADQTRGSIALVLINNGAVAASHAVKLAGLSLEGDLTGEQSTASGYWNPLVAFPPASAAAFTITLPPASVTSIGGRFHCPA
jgi:O-glycosyl hydrolase